ncbi:MAG: Hsp33 family molecular chaperone HslO [Candidatus Obscuribacterales bacterium]|nr:Hsp33 family molecular chaperone HslO [Candidatus Obscuribacterales bacterium]
MEDGLIRTIDVLGTIDAVIVSSTNLVEAARLKHKMSYTAAAALGRALTSAALLLPIIARRGQLSMKFQGNGPLGRVVVDATSGGRLRGYVENPQIELPLNSLGNLDVGAAVGTNGYLHVTVDDGFGKQHTSTVELVSGEIGEDVNRYLVSCHDAGSVLIVGVHLSRDGTEAAGGMLVQLLPDHSEETICKLENNLASFGTFTFLMRRGMELEDILKRGLQGFDLDVISNRQSLSFDCGCSKERFIQALKVLDKEEIMQMASSGEAEGRCQFCNAVYHVPPDGLLEIAQAM